MYNKKKLLFFSIVLVAMFILPIQNAAGFFSPEENAATIQAASQERIAESKAEATKMAAMFIGGAIVLVGLIALIITNNKKNNKPTPEDIDKVTEPEPKTDHLLFCSQCGKKINPGDLFCSACGRKLEN